MIDCCGSTRALSGARVQPLKQRGHAVETFGGGRFIITTDEDGFTDSSNGSTTVSCGALIKQAIPGTTGSCMHGMDRIATLFHGPANRIKTGQVSQRIDHLNVLATVLSLYGVLDQFKADFEARHTATTDAVRIKEAKSQVANLTPITGLLA